MQSTKIFYYAKLMLILLLSIMIFITLSGIILAQNNSIKYKYPNVVADQTAREISLKNNKSNALISFYIAIQYISNYKSTDDMFEVMKWYELAGCKEWKMLYIYSDFAWYSYCGTTVLAPDNIFVMKPLTEVRVFKNGTIYVMSNYIMAIQVFKAKK